MEHNLEALSSRTPSEQPPFKSTDDLRSKGLWNWIKAWRLSPFWFCFREHAKIRFPLNQNAPSSLSRGSCFSSECDGCRCQRRLPDHVDSVSPKTPQTLQTAPETHHGVPVKPRRRSRSEVRVHRDTFVCSEIFLYQDRGQASSHLLPLSSL